jgi:hypothetical protein
MNLSCPEKSVESEKIAEIPFLGGSFLTPNLKRGPEGILTISQFTTLLENSMKEGKLTQGEAFSFAVLQSSIQREYCHALNRYVFYLHKYVTTRDSKYKEKAQKYNQYVQDMLTCLEFTEQIQKQGAEANLVTPTESMRPLSWQALGLKEKFQSGESKYTQQRLEIQEQMADLSNEDLLKLEKDMLVYSKEKNKAATNLLGMYAFLNLTAIGLLLYIFRTR